MFGTELQIDNLRQSNYNVIMIVKLIKIGNSQGIRIPKSLIEQCGLDKEVELVLKGKNLIIKPKTKPRQGWEEECKLMHENGDDELVWPEFFDDWEFEEWEWE